VIKTFRGKIADDGLDTIVLHTNDGSTGYRIKKLDVLAPNPAAANSQSVLKIYLTPQSAADELIDFSDQTLLAAVNYDNSASTNYNAPAIIIFDNMTFNQDIYITHKDVAGSESLNYYLELEQVKLDINENTVATLKDIRNIKRTASLSPP